MGEIDSYPEFRQKIEDIANQLCYAVDGSFDFRVRESTTDPTIEKLQLLINFMLDTMFRTINTLENQTSELHRQVELAQAASVAKANFLANMSHEIRTPLNGIVGLTSLLQHTRLDNHQADLLNGIRLSSDNLLSVINEVLDFSKIEAGKIRLESISFDLAAMAQEVAESLAARAAQKDVELIVRYKPGTPHWVITDESRLRQVLINLVGNAIKFTPCGHVMISIERSDGEFYIEVIDTGIGIDPNQQDMLFEQFTQADNSITRQYGGTGLGLAISRGIIQALQGRIGVKPNPSGGSIFWISVPLATDQDAHPPLPSLALGRQKVRVLIVDDNAINRLVLREQLQHWGVDCVQATHGTEALELIQTAQPPIDIVLVDYSMPGQDGISLIRQIRSQGIPSPALVLFSSINGEFTEDFLLREGISGYLLKPSPPEHIHSMLQVLSAGRAGKPIPALLTRHTLRDSGTEPPVPQPEATQFLRVMVVEDNVVNQMVAKSQLEKLGCSVCIANTGLEALEQLRQLPIDMIFMDMQMPEMNGLDATRAIREHKQAHLRTIPIIALTANASQEDQDLCLDAGMNAFITKPFRPAELSKALNTWGKRLEQPTGT